MRHILWTISLLLAALTSQAQSPINRNKVMEYLQEQQYEEAVAYLLPAINNNITKDVALLAYTYYLSGNITESAVRYEQVLQLDSNYLPALQYLAAIRMQQEAYPAALQLYRRITVLRPLQATAWKQLSFAAFTAQQPDSGFVWLLKTYQLNQKDPKVVARLAEEWIEQKNYPAADSAVMAYIATDSLHPGVLMAAAKTSFFKKDYRRTMAIGEQLRALHYISPNIFMYIIVACYYLKKYEAAISFYDYMKAGNAATENITYYAALSYTALRKYQESNELLQLCISMAKSASLVNYYNGIAVNYENLRQFKPAVANLDTAYYLSRQPLLQYSIGRIYETGLNNDAVAMKFYKRYLQLYKPGTTEEKDIYRYLKSRVK